ncbi:carboxymuconolactone decarboxylase family protein [Streptomyces sp. NBC_01275]|uniref:carboxymuconolactone decarboxylase family protein n=1 Tax=Streptomyces sp. NBC_01275 TaxID=2903807 RepID=UPI00225869E1|nr:carboxymuconolactone decarboxylase family protein [Streptomyces sp. NBC_01275]MCX4765139.1 carboxymuconolactone decarboxylase family protein [Streptomyces sp. NBC_01275]
MPRPTPRPPRLPLLDPGELSPEQRTLYEEITRGPRARGPRHFALTDADGRLHGPFNAMLLSPALGRSLQELGAAIRYASGLSPRVRELSILVVAAAWDCAFERYAHERVGRAAGLTEPELTALRESRDPQLADPREHAAWELARTLTVPVRALDDEGYERARTALGERALFELSTLVGYYATLALQLRLFAVPAPR